MLAIYLGGEKEVDHGFLKVDIVVGDIAIEVKYNANFYDGFGQVLAYKYILGYPIVYLIHVYDYIPVKFVEYIFKLAKSISINAIVLVKYGEKIYEWRTVD